MQVARRFYGHPHCSCQPGATENLGQNVTAVGIIPIESQRSTALSSDVPTRLRAEYDYYKLGASLHNCNYQTIKYFIIKIKLSIHKILYKSKHNLILLFLTERHVSA